jgi:uncharacterized protein YciI
METTHFLYLARPPRSTFVVDATPSEMEVIGRHFAFLQELLDQGKLLLTGPTLDGAYGVAILKITAQAEAEEIVRQDPAVTAGLFRPELHPMHVGLMAL